MNTSNLSQRRIPAESFHPGEFLKDELDARNWSQIEFSEIIGKDSRLVYEIVNGKRSITPETAILFAEALRTSPDVWMNLESQYQLSKVHSKESSVSRRADLYTRFPVREMIKRGWIEATKNIDTMEGQICTFFGMKCFNDNPELFPNAAKKQSYNSDVPIQQIAWFYRAKKIALSAPAQKYDAKNLSVALDELRAEAEYAEGIRNVPSILSKFGIRLVVVEPLSGSKIDGACFWLEKKYPVIAMTLRYDRVDNFWHVLMHEIDHIKHKEGVDHPIIESDILDANIDELPEIEKRANEAAADILVPSNEMTGFVVRVNPMFTEEQIVGFSRRIHIHPGIVVGQLQRRKLIHWSVYRKRLVKIREFIVGNAITDGYGQIINDLGEK
jgi:HTH-type transcriptional regulator/antitoxin HigA